MPQHSQQPIIDLGLKESESIVKGQCKEEQAEMKERVK